MRLLVQLSRQLPSHNSDSGKTRCISSNVVRPAATLSRAARRRSSIPSSLAIWGADSTAASAGKELGSSESHMRKQLELVDRLTPGSSMPAERDVLHPEQEERMVVAVVECLKQCRASAHPYIRLSEFITHLQSEYQWSED